MYARGILAKGQPTEVIWSRKLGINLFRNTIPCDKYKELLRYIRFDIRSTRSQRLQNDKFALISMVWDRFVENCKLSNRPGENITIDEQLFLTKARYPFTQYMAKKPDKFDIKFWLAVDATSKYLVNGFPYLGKDSQRPANKFISEYIVMKLMEPYLDKGRNVKTNNFFTSLSLANELQKNRTTILGTMNRARKEIPSELKATKQALFSSLIFVNSGKTLTFYQGKKNKNVLILSSVHKSVKVLDVRKRLPESIQYYNETKYGVDILDQMARLYSTKMSFRRWLFQFFYNILDFAGINAVILYREVTGKKITLCQFLNNLITELIDDGDDESKDDIEENNQLFRSQSNCSTKNRSWRTVNCSKQNL
ncbi:piggyBac transposable element-derived protein 4-like [Lepeophtheirus salmonis]|uniref:piggyBac transposable element-derived protein 4-like n=1 Tax=Lepeophtheirus salmonis TaxID=72036 RepID=UPI003AF3C7A7